MVEVLVVVSNFWGIHLVTMGGEVVEGGLAFCVVGWQLDFLFANVEVIGVLPLEGGRETLGVDLMRPVESG